MEAIKCAIFFVYDKIKTFLWRNRNRRENGNGDGNGDGERDRSRSLLLHQSIITGCIAGAVGPILNCPCDVIKTRMMAAESTVLGFVGWFVHIYQYEGVRVFYRGLTPRLMRVAGGQAIMWTMVEQTQKWYKGN